MDSDIHPKAIPPPRIVKPRVRHRSVLPVIAVVDDRVLTEDGETLLLDELVCRMPDLPSTLFAAAGAADLLAYFDNIFSMSHPAQWQWRVSEQKRRSYGRQLAQHRARSYRVTIAVHFFGFKNRSNKHYHKLIDPITMYGKSLDKVYPGPESRLVRLLKWAITLRDFCAANNLDIRPTIGAISGQFLTDPRFYPNARRKVPAKTNARVREELPGNHYRLMVTASPDRTYTAIELDQHQAHHYHAQCTRFPHADHLYAFGCFHNLSDCYTDHVNPNFLGLYCLDLKAPRFFAHSWIKGHGKLERQFVYTNELPHLLDMGYGVLGVRAAWGSHHRDRGLNKFATWARTTLTEYDNPGWLKQLLLSTYGTLASRPTDAEAIFRLASGGEEITRPTGRRSLTGKAVHRKRKLEPGIANVLHRGMIEAATRTESIGMAQWLEHQGQRLLSIYADAVFIEDNENHSLPPIPEPWEVKRVHTHLRFYDVQAWESDQGRKMPGIPRRQTPIRSPVIHLSRLSLVTGDSNGTVTESIGPADLQ